MSINTIFKLGAGEGEAGNKLTIRKSNIDSPTFLFWFSLRLAVKRFHWLLLRFNLSVQEPSVPTNNDFDYVILGGFWSLGVDIYLFMQCFSLRFNIPIYWSRRRRVKRD